MKLLLKFFTFLIFLISTVITSNAISKTSPYKPLEDTISNIIPSSVVIQTEKGHGSGIILSSDGIIVSNLHVIVDGNNINVKLSNGSLYEEVKILGFDEKNDLVILKVEGSNLPFVDIQQFSEAKIGQTVYALGAPEGLEQSLSKGIVSSIRLLEDRPLIQTDAAISSGSSGGGLFTQDGALIGILVSYYKEGQNLNFAIPSRLIEPLINNSSALTESEFFALDIHQINAYEALNAMSSNDILNTFLKKMASEYNFEFTVTEKGDSYIGVYNEEVLALFEVFDDLLLVTLPILTDTEITSDDFIVLNNLSIESNYSYIGFLDGKINVYAEMPLKNVKYEAFESVVSGAINGYFKAQKSELIKRLNEPKEIASTEPNYLSKFTNTLPTILLTDDDNGFTSQVLPKNMAFSYDAKSYTFKVLEQSDDYIEISLYQDKKRVFMKVISEQLGDVENSIEASAFIVTSYIEELQNEVSNLKVIDQGTRRIGDLNSVWIKFEYSEAGLRYKFQSNYVIINNTGLTFHAWSLDDFSKLDKELVKIIEQLNF